MQYYYILFYVVCKIMQPFEWNRDHFHTSDHTLEKLYRKTHNLNDEYLPLPEYIFYKIIFRKLAFYISYISDIACSLYLKDSFYLVPAALHGSYLYSLRSIFTYIYETKKYKLSLETCIFIDPYFIVLADCTLCEKLTALILYYDIFVSKMAVMIHPCANVFWFYYMNMFKQYINLMHNIILLSYLYISTLSQSRLDQIFLALIFNDTSYVEFYIFNLLRRGNNCSVYSAMCCLFYVAERYVIWMFKNTGSGNLNFVNWFNMFFVLVNVFDYNFMPLPK